MHFYRDSNGNEVDAVLQEAQYHIPVEIKSASTLSSALFAGLHRFSKVVDFTINPMLVYAGGEERIQNGVQVLNHWSIESALRKL